MRLSLSRILPAESAGDQGFDYSKNDGTEHGDKHQVNENAKPFFILHSCSFTKR